MRETMQRVRIGLTGLALVFLVVVLGFVVRSASDDASLISNVAGQASAEEAAANGQQPTEPLAQLGVAPGNTDLDNGAAATGSRR